MSARSRHRRGMHPKAKKRHESTAQVLLPGVSATQAWDFLRDPASACVLLPDVVQAAVVSGAGLGERQRFVSRAGREEHLSLVEVTGLVPHRLIELTLLNRPYSAGRQFQLEDVAGGALLTVRSWASAGWSWF